MVLLLPQPSSELLKCILQSQTILKTMLYERCNLSLFNKYKKYQCFTLSKVSFTLILAVFQIDDTLTEAAFARFPSWKENGKLPQQVVPHNQA